MSTSNFKNADSILSVTLRKNQFSAEENSFIGRVTRNTVTLENLIVPISEKKVGVSPYMIQHVANLLGMKRFLPARMQRRWMFLDLELCTSASQEV